MPRFFAPISVEDFQNKLFQALLKHPDFSEIVDYQDKNKKLDSWDSLFETSVIGGSKYTSFNYQAARILCHLTPQIEKDIKVRFDLENVNGPGEGSSDGAPLGVHTLDNGMTFLGLSAGGDWEYPVYLIVYWDGSKLRAYVPTDGNFFNSSTMQAYGNEGEDVKNFRKRFPELAEELGLTAENDEDDYLDIGNIPEDWEKIEADIKSRILPTGSVEKKPKTPSDPKPEPTTDKEKLQEQVRILTEALKRAASAMDKAPVFTRLDKSAKAARSAIERAKKYEVKT